MKTDPLCVLLVVEPGIDGVFRCVEAQARRLLERGLRVHLAYSSRRGGPALTQLVAHVRAAGGQTLDLRIGNMPGPRDTLALAQLWRLVRAQRPDVIHGHSFKAGALVRLLRWLGVGAPIFYTPHAYYRMNQKMSFKGVILIAVERLLGRVGKTIHVSRSESAYGREVIRLASERQVVCYNGVNTARFTPVDAAARARLRAELGWPAGALVLGTVARYGAQKAPLTLYPAVLAALAADPLLHFAHLGEGDLRPKVDRLLAASPHRDRVHQIAALAEPHTFYQALDGFILPSRYEGLALAALEALSVGLPMILTDCPGNDELKSHELDSIHWTPVDDIPALTAAIGAWAAESRAGKTSNHREVTLRVFDLTRCCDLIVETYATVARHTVTPGIA